MDLTRAYLKDLVYKVNGAAIKVHRTLGPGLLESVYYRCMMYELQLRNISYRSEMSIPIKYGDLELDAAIRCDLLVEDVLVVEFKAIERVLPIHIVQILTYMKLLQLSMGLMINFNCTHIFSEGQKTYVNEFYEALY